MSPKPIQFAQAYLFSLGYSHTNGRGISAPPLTQVPLPQTLHPHPSAAMTKATSNGDRAVSTTRSTTVCGTVISRTHQADLLLQKAVSTREPSSHAPFHRQSPDTTQLVAARMHYATDVTRALYRIHVRIKPRTLLRGGPRSCP